MTTVHLFDMQASGILKVLLKQYLKENLLGLGTTWTSSGNIGMLKKKIKK